MCFCVIVVVLFLKKGLNFYNVKEVVYKEVDVDSEFINKCIK